MKTQPMRMMVGKWYRVLLFPFVSRLLPSVQELVGELEQGCGFLLESLKVVLGVRVEGWSWVLEPIRYRHGSTS